MFDMQEIYRDQSMSNTQVGDRNIFCAYLPFGIKRMDAAYSILIKWMKSTKDASILRDSIKNNPHLHFEIKHNLILNLENFREQYSDEAKSYFRESWRERGIANGWDILEDMDYLGIKENTLREFRYYGPFKPGVRQY